MIYSILQQALYNQIRLLWRDKTRLAHDELETLLGVLLLILDDGMPWQARQYPMQYPIQ